MRVAIVGAGVSGLANARVLHGLGVEVVVFESRPDVGGVWSSTRGYPGLRTQNDRRTYAFSDRRMAADVPEHPSAADVRHYLEAWAAHHGLVPLLRLATAVRRAERDPADGSWTIEADGPAGCTSERFDRLVLANGINSTPNDPGLTGTAEFVRAGGRLVEASDLGDGAVLRDARVVVLGLGKSATDIATAAASTARSVDVVARRLPWKLPYRIGRTPFQRIAITRLGEHLLWAPVRTPLGRVMRRIDAPLRVAYRTSLQRRVQRQQSLKTRGLAPDGDIATFTHLETAGFLSAVDAGRIALHLGEGIERLHARPEPGAALTGGAVLPADVLVVATGYDQDLSCLDDATRALLVDDRGQLRLHRHTLAAAVPTLALAGWTNSFRSPIAAELQALWIAGLLHGLVRIPPPERRVRTEQVLQSGHGSARRNDLPLFSSGLSAVDQDAWVRDLGLRVPLRARVRELLLPVDPGHYRGLQEQLRRRLRGR